MRLWIGLDLIQFFFVIAPNVHYLFTDFHINYEMFLVVAFYDGNGRSAVVVVITSAASQKQNPSFAVNEIEFHGLKLNINILVIYCVYFQTPLFLNICSESYSMLKHIQNTPNWRSIASQPTIRSIAYGYICIWSRL